MSYLFDPDNWEWLTTGNNVRLILYFALGLPGSWKQGWEDAMPGWAPEAFQSGLVLGALLGLILYNSSVLAEIMRAGILSLPRGQGEAASALGMTYMQSLRYIILPQGLRRMVPATVSQLITLNKDTTLVSIIAITEVMRRARIVTASNFFTVVEAPILQVFIFVGFLFVVVNYALSRLSRRLELRERKRSGTKLKRVGGLEDQVGVDPA
jgi:ABC-type amino acid transport system permease subunit